MRTWPFILGMSAALAKAQTTPVLSLEQAVEEALTRNQTLLAERSNIDIARAGQITARLRPNPVATVSGLTLNLLGATYSPDSPLGPNQFNFHVDLPIERSSKRQARIALAREETALAELSFRESLRQLIAEVYSAYIEVQLAQENLKLAEQTLDRFNQLVRINEARLAAGDLSEVELQRSRVALLQYSAAFEQAKLRLFEAKSRLALTLGRESAHLDTNFAVEPGFRDGPLGTTKQEAVALALNQRPDLLALRQALERNRVYLQLQLASARVDYSLGTEVSRQWAFGIAGNNLGFSLSVPLPVFNRNQGEIARAQREIEQAQRRLAAAELSVRTDVERAYQRCLSHQDLAQRVEQDLLGRARRVLEGTRYSYERGEASLVELLDAQRAFIDAVQIYNEARANYSRSLLELRSATAESIQGKP
ncbi:MAG: TolC family protein [Bryobacteraceae bacterium]|nr:TolC family protein [Bryobacteraceae bacterium]MDW8378365.1 TolC family protein [Bryobacterales bacterium]